MASMRQKKKNVKTRLLRENKARIAHLDKMSVENNIYRNEVKDLKRQLKTSKGRMKTLQTFSEQLEHEVRATARKIAEQEADAIEARFRESWASKLSNEGKNQAIRLLHDKGILKSKSDYYKDFLIDNIDELTNEEIDEAIQKHYEEARFAHTEFVEREAALDEPFANYKNKRRK